MSVPLEWSLNTPLIGFVNASPAAWHSAIRLSARLEWMDNWSALDFNRSVCAEILLARPLVTAISVLNEQTLSIRITLERIQVFVLKVVYLYLKLGYLSARFRDDARSEHIYYLHEECPPNDSVSFYDCLQSGGSETDDDGYDVIVDDNSDDENTDVFQCTDNKKQVRTDFLSNS